MLLVTPGCKHNFFHSRLSEGTIEYKIVVLDSNNAMAKFAPDKMMVKFKDNQSFARIIAGMGLFETDFINDEPGKRIVQMVRLLNKKVYYVADTASINKELGKSPQLIITRDTGTKMIAGYKCKMAKVSYKDANLPPFDIYYTDEIELQNPNWATPFKDIKGVLMGYRINRYGFYLQFTASKVEPSNIDDALFKIPSQYRKINKQQIDALYRSFQ